MTPRRADLLRAVALGVLQGPAEVLPVSSSAHTELLAARLGAAYLVIRYYRNRGKGGPDVDPSGELPHDRRPAGDPSAV